MKLLALSLMLLVSTLPACISLKNSPPIVENNSFTDNNYPQIHLIFPFNIYLDDSQVQFGDNVKASFYKMKTDEASIEVYIRKEEIFSGGYVFLGTDDALKKQPFFIEKFKKGYCSTNLIKDKVYSFVEVEARKYINNKQLIRVNIYHNVGIVPSKELWKEKNRETVKQFVNYTIGLCGQIFPTEKVDPYIQADGKYAAN